MSRYKVYPEYKDSGVEWLGEIPIDWFAIKFGITNSSAILGGNYLAGEGEDGIPVIKMGNLGRGEINLRLLERLPVHEKYEIEHLLKEGDFLFNTRNSLDLVGKVAIWRNELDFAVYNSNVLRITFHKKFVKSTSFMNYLFNSDLGFSQLRLIAKGTTSVAAIYYKELRSLVFGMPPLDHQILITNFLDHETAKIDTLIAKQQELIKLLKEKRQAVISHAVTKGLNPNAPMRDSGVEWLGEVPEHWTVSKFKYLVIEGSAGPYGSSLTKSMYTTSGVRVYGQQQVIPDDFTIGDYYISEDKFESMRRYEVFPEEILISVMGTVGKVAIVPFGIERGIINPRLVKYRIQKEKILPQFVKASILSDVSQSQLLFAAQGSTMDGLNMQILGELPIAFPSLDEQENILQEISRQDMKFSLLLVKAQRTADLLAERRTALISAAVTGKIDVRDWQAPSETALAAR